MGKFGSDSYLAIYEFILLLYIFKVDMQLDKYYNVFWLRENNIEFYYYIYI